MTSSPPATECRPLKGESLLHLLRLVREINAVLDSESLLPVIARQVRQLVDYRVFEILLPVDENTLKPAHLEGYEQDLASAPTVRLGAGITGTAAQLREPVFVPNVQDDPRYVGKVSGITSELVLPLVTGGRLVGLLNVETAEAGAFTSEVRTALRVLANHTAVALENASLYREARWYAGLLGTLYEIGKETASILDLDELLHRVAEIVKRVIDYEVFGILLLDETTDELVLRKAVRFGDYGEKTRIKRGRGLIGAAMNLKQPVLVGNVLEDPRYLHMIPETRSELVVPLIHKDRVLGVFDLESSRPHRFTDKHVKILTPLASQVAIAIENARLYDELRRKELRFEKELSIARGMQKGLFPEECPAGPDWEASAHFLPARELGGDLYDFYELSERTLGLAVGDVAGKGVPAALYGAFASGTVRARAFGGRTPAELLERVNRTLRHRGVEGRFCTLTYAIFDFEQRRLTLANSGLPYPLHYKASTGRSEALTVAGLPLGAFDDARYEERTVDIGPGDVLVFHSDGVSEAYNGRESYGTRRLTDMLERHAGETASSIGERVLADLRTFLGHLEPEDDVTLVVVRIR